MARTATVDLDPVDGGLLATLDARRFEYGAVLAHEFGLDPSAVRRRCRCLADRGFVERVTRESLYRVTDAGRRYLVHRTATPRPGSSDPSVPSGD